MERDQHLDQEMTHHHPLRRPGLRNSGLWIAAMLLLAGCAAPATRPATKAPSPQASETMDPCALRLHDLEGGLLLYYAQHQQLPPDLKSVTMLSGGALDASECPVSHQPYIYDPSGLPAPGNKRLIVYDAMPAHQGKRWAVAADEPKPGQPMILQVLSEPEVVFLPHPAR